jgi:hypothetical protein
MLRLCYVSGQWAYFTSQELDKQWGDDWDDAPYEHNAGSPYGPHRDDEAWDISQVAWEGPFTQPCDGHCNSPYSVQMINAGAVAWLRTEAWHKSPVVIPAGTSLGDFIRLVQSAGGTVYLPVEVPSGEQEAPAAPPAE